MAVLHKPTHDRPVRIFDAEDLAARVGVGVEVHEAQRSVDGSAGARICLGDRVVATEDHGERARGQDLPHGLLDGGVGASGVGGDDRGVAEVENPQLSERVDACLEVGPGGQLAARIARGAKQVPGLSETSSSIGAPTITTSAPPRSDGSCVYGTPPYESGPA